MDEDFSARLGGDPDEAYLKHLRKPEFQWMAEHFFEPLVALNRSQAIMLFETDLIDRETASALLEAIDDIEDAGSEAINDFETYEDPYLEMEARISDLAGQEAGGQLHMGRSRNDLFAAVVRMIVRRRLLEVCGAILDLREAVQDRAAETVETVMPGFTHSQPAQPVTLGHYLTAFDHLLSRDTDRLLNAFERTNRSPLGAAALGGTGFDIDRKRLADLAGFDEVCPNTYDAVASMDYVPEATTVLAQLMTSLSRLSRDLIEWATYQFGYVTLADELSTVSSIMPQKKNPVVLEKTRTEASNTIGAATSALVHLKGAPFGDVREVSKYVFVPFVEQSPAVVRSLSILLGVIETMSLHEERMLADATNSFCTATELADTLVRDSGLTFRQAHTVVARLVRDTAAADETATDITTNDLERAAEETIGQPVDLASEALSAALDPETNVERRVVQGGTAPEATREDLEAQANGLAAQRSRYEAVTDRLDAAAQQRRERAEDIA